MPEARVVEDHEDDYHEPAQDCRLDPFPDRVLPQGRTDGDVLYHGDRGRKSAGPEHDGQVFRLVRREAAREVDAFPPDILSLTTGAE